jgi:hypothetical protein
MPGYAHRLKCGRNLMLIIDRGCKLSGEKEVHHRDAETRRTTRQAGIAVLRAS